jgi:hypothetical protein
VVGCVPYRVRRRGGGAGGRLAEEGLGGRRADPQGRVGAGRVDGAGGPPRGHGGGRRGGRGGGPAAGRVVVPQPQLRRDVRGHRAPAARHARDGAVARDGRALPPRLDARGAPEVRRPQRVLAGRFRQGSNLNIVP